jgi:hypothetical protein
MLQDRGGRIFHVLQEQDTESIMDALTSLRVTSSTTGARTTEAQCRETEEHVRWNRFDKALEAAAVLHAGVIDLIAAGPDVLRAAHSVLHAEPVRAISPDTAGEITGPATTLVAPMCLRA